MGLFNINALWFFLILIPILIFYFFRSKNKNVIVSTTEFWKTQQNQTLALSIFQKFRSNRSLLFYLIITTLLIFAFAKPFISTTSSLNGDSIIIIDTSASMLATDIKPTRFNDVIKEANKLIDTLPSERSITLINAGLIPKLVIQTKVKKLAKQKLTTLIPTLTSSNTSSALKLAETISNQLNNPTIFYLTDKESKEYLAKLPKEISYRQIPIGTSFENLAITKFQVIKSKNDSLIINATLNWDGNKSLETEIELMINSQLYDIKTISFSPKEQLNLQWTNIPKNSSTISLNILTNDFFQLDNKVIYLNPHKDQTINIITEKNDFLENLTGLFEGYTIKIIRPKEYTIINNADVSIFNNFLPNELPKGDLLIINPPIDNKHFKTTPLSLETNSIEQINIINETHPIMNFIDLKELIISEFYKNELPLNIKPIINYLDNPLISAWEESSQKRILISFPLEKSNFGKLTSFPILFYNSIEWFSSENNFMTGNLNNVKVGEIENNSKFTLTMPSNKFQIIDLNKKSIEEFTNEIGIYSLNQTIDSKTNSTNSTKFTINFIGSTESNFQNIPQIISYSNTSTNIQPSGKIKNEFVSWILIIVLIILILEWIGRTQWK